MSSEQRSGIRRLFQPCSCTRSDLIGNFRDPDCRRHPEGTGPTKHYGIEHELEHHRRMYLEGKTSVEDFERLIELPLLRLDEWARS